MGLLILALQNFTQSYSILYLIMDYFGTIPGALGLLLLMLGVRSHYSIWSSDKNFRSDEKDRVGQKLVLFRNRILGEYVALPE